MSLSLRKTIEKHPNTWMWVAIILAFVPMLLLRDFTPDNEGRYLIIADEALRNGHYFAFTLNGVPYADKPPLYFWLVMLCRQLLGFHSMTALGLLSLLPACGVVAVMNRLTGGLLTTSDRRTATLMLMTTAYFAGPAMVVRMDMLMCLFIVLAMWVFWEMYQRREPKASQQWLLGVWLFLALFTKGPLGVMIPVCAIMAMAVLHRKWSMLGKWLNWRSWLVLVVACGLWFGMTYREGGADYLNDLLFHQTVGRGIRSFHHARPAYYYLISIWYEWLPWSLLSVAGIVIGVRRRYSVPTVSRLLLIMPLTTLVLLSCISSKLQVYLLPAMPFVVYFTAWAMHSMIPRPCAQGCLAIPQALLILALPALVVAAKVTQLSALTTPWAVAAAAWLTLASAWALYYNIVKKDITLSVRTLACGVLGTLFLAGLAIPAFHGLLNK